MANTICSVCYRCIHPRRKSKTLYKSDLDVDNPVYDEAGVGLLNPHEGSVASGLDNPIYGYYTPSGDSQIPVKTHNDFGQSFSGIAIARNPKRLRSEEGDQDSSTPYQEYQSLLQPDGEK